jgi:hypothetical protein
LKKKPAIGVCATCPWRKENHGKAHPANWYTAANLRRLWNGLRSGKSPGMVCHATDPESPEYGSTKAPPASARKQDCAGALALVHIEMNALSHAPSFEAYRRARPDGLTRTGAYVWAERIIFGPRPPAFRAKFAELATPKENALKKNAREESRRI